MTALEKVGGACIWTAQLMNEESRFPAPGYAGRRLRSTACNERTTPLVPLASLDLPNRARRVAYGSMQDGRTNFRDVRPELDAAVSGRTFHSLRQ